ncbi:MAG: HAMP domain-containing sensor histidine kinase [Pseudoxanthomonas suwonensis]|nr:HAMP domain-containing sensor histidine kinase [Pseudoxanthomonas suwonensis]
MPYSANSCFAWYSWKFMDHRIVGRRTARRPGPALIRARGAQRAAYSRRCAAAGQNPAPHLYSGAPPPESPRLPLPADNPVAPGTHLRRELYFFNLYRLLAAAVLGLLLMGPMGTLLGEPTHPRLAMGLGLAYIGFALAMLLRQPKGVQAERRLQRRVLRGVAVDIAVAMVAIWLLPYSTATIAMLLLFGVAAAAVLLPLREGMAMAALAALALSMQTVWAAIETGLDAGSVLQRLLFALGYGAAALLAWSLAQSNRESHDLALQQGLQLENLAHLNELVIRRMRTGVLLVDGNGRIRLANEAALALLDADIAPQGVRLADISPALAQQVTRWRQSRNAPQQPVNMGEDAVEVLPRIVQLQAGDDAALVFLDDAEQVSRRAETISLAAMGRFSASLAHEIRNPLAAIQYATQLLQESTDIREADRHLLNIVRQQCQRTNAIIDSVLGMARRERASPQRLDLWQQAQRFARDHATIQPDLADHLTVADAPTGGTAAMADPEQLQQVLAILVGNAMTHGRQPDAPPRVRLQMGTERGEAWLEVVDRGPGIPPARIDRLFQPFNTTSEHGTGLGLYIARELCRANQGQLEYRPVPGGGSCFRIRLPSGDTFKLLS